MNGIEHLGDLFRAAASEHTLLKLIYTAINETVNPVVITDKDGRIVWVNKAFTEVMGYTYEEAVGQNPRILKSGLHDKEFYKNMWDTILSGKTWKGIVYNKLKNGKIEGHFTCISAIQDNGKTFFVGVKQICLEQLSQSIETQGLSTQSRNVASIQ
jgi:PAS domain S-box-containing protein